MNTNYTWKISGMTCYPEHAGQQNVVFNVDFNCNGDREYSGSTYYGNIFRSVNVQHISGSTFIPYDQLTEAEVLQWVLDELGFNNVENIQNSVEQQIDDQINPPTIAKPLPW